MPAEDIITGLKVYGSQAYISSMRAASVSVQQLEGSQSRLARSSRAAGEKLDNLASSATRGAGKIGMLAAATGGWAAKTGLNFNAVMERTQIGIEGLVGNATEAQKITERVRDFALETPLFGVEQMMKTAQTLIGAGYDAKNVVPYLRVFSDTLSGMGKRPEDLQRMTYAFTQMMQKGKVSSEELQQQLGEIFPAQKILAREMGLTGDQLADKMKKGSVKSKDAIFLLMRGMNKDFGGMTEKMSKTFDGQLANLKESAKYSLGTLFMPLFKTLEKQVFPQLNLFNTHLVGILGDSSKTAEEKWREIKELWNAWILPMFQEWGRELEKWDIGKKIGDALDAAMPVIMPIFADIGKKALKAMFDAWMGADTWTKFFTGAILFSKLIGFKTLFGGIGTLAAKAFLKKWGAAVATEEALAGMEAKGGLAGGRWGKGFGALAAAGAILIIGDQVNKWLTSQPWYQKMIRDVDKKVGAKHGQVSTFIKGITPGNPIQTAKSMGKSFTDVYDLWTDLMKDPSEKGGWKVPKGATVKPNLPMLQPTMARPSLAGGITIHNYTVLDSRIVSKSVTKHAANEQARK